MKMAMTRRTFLGSLVAAPLAATTRALALGGICLGIVIIIVGLLIIYFLVRCLRSIKPRTLPNPAVGYLWRDGRIIYPEECPAEAIGSANPRGSIEVLCHPDGSTSITRQDGTLSRGEAESMVTSFGLSTAKPSASLDRKPVPPASSPIHITPAAAGQPVRVAIETPVGEPSRAFDLQTSPDLVNWATVLTARIPEDHTFSYNDMEGDGARFYRQVPI